MKVLLAVDDSTYCEAAVGMVSALKMGTRSEATILTVIPEHVFPGGHTLADLVGRSTALKAQLRKAEEERALEVLGGPAKTLGARGLRVETTIRRGNPAHEIIKTCRSTQADLVLVGFKGTGDAPEFLLGGTAHKVIKYAPCSVLVAKGEARAIKEVLVPLDGSRHADEAVQFLLRMPLPRRAEVLLMTVVQSFAPAFVKAYAADVEGSRRIIAGLQQAEEEAARRLMTEAESQFHRKGYKVSTLVARGDPSREILREAVRRNVDLIALGAKGLTGVRRFMLGSVSQRVARYAGSSVLIVRPPNR
ncbi:MAG: universal stress protein [Dehalococcoidia bacterium]|nr:universal stress protein [Dehalococcoidia bacterium]